MTWRDKLELGIKENAPFRKDNLPPARSADPRSIRAPAGRPKFRRPGRTTPRAERAVAEPKNR